MHILDFWNDEVTAYINLKAKAVGALASAEAELAPVRANQRDAVSRVAQAQKDIAALRVKMATDSPADVAADSVKLRQLIAKLRDASGEALLQGALAIKWQNALARAHGEIDRATQKLAEATAAAAAAASTDGTITIWQAALAAPPLSTLKDDADDKRNGLNGSTERAAAQAVLDAYFPGATCLVQSASAARRVVYNGIHKHIHDLARSTRALLVSHLAAANAGRENHVRAAQITFDLASNELAHYARSAGEEYDRALALYASVAALPPTLPATIESDILTASSYGTKANTALPFEQARNAAVTTADNDRYALDVARIAAESVDPTSSAVDATVAAAILKADDSKAMLLSKDTPFIAPGGKKGDLDAWEAALPDDAIRAVLAMQEADEILTRLAGLDPATLVSALASADQALANALLAAAASERTTAYLEDALAERLASLSKAEDGRLDNLFSFVRGDR